ncbi:hypothetical protein BABINDRAFT_7528 [Babjeviella inositovora NRRL Y-12698]|uniref:Transcription initiation factor IIA large subunit n=1 Tax=Babjeviella inositovora NRRL Y-12698 TaxID=984486 RepID=A0A1E3QT10_9ASCO|nr:uncharacterized protein BABINDRAFT_7528 [Babjeviella inositovora NRRL Y-12698]ODQ80845.1 hypothetical protein BABINDRAFT_7528 [Babjeviella inositovora NRRL Y-12698]
MSAAEAAKLYESIIDDVINESRQDFEDSGIDEATLQELMQIWREKLSGTGVGQFSWDPRPDPEEAAAAEQIKHEEAALKKEEADTKANFEMTIDTLNGEKAVKVKKERKPKTRVKKERSHSNDPALEGLSDISSDEEGFNDSDDINSDLDDSDEDDLLNDSDFDGEGEGEGDVETNTMLCLYDKVQRVKNKWKSNLKEGVANINGKDYAFQKANGESEW